MSTQNQALSSLLFLYRDALGVDLPWLTELRRPSRPPRIPSVLTQSEVAALLGAMGRVTGLLPRLVYGTGMRLMKALRLWVKGMDSDRQVLLVRQGKGGKDRSGDVAAEPVPGEAGAVCTGPCAVGAGSGRRGGVRGGAGCAGGEVSRSGLPLGLVLGVSGAVGFGRFALGGGAADTICA